MKKSYSESIAWETMLEGLSQATEQLGSSVRDAAVTLQHLVELSRDMVEQVRSGFHTNPALVVWPNPPRVPVAVQPIDVLSSRVYEIRYRHRDDDRDYRHAFGRGVKALLVQSEAGKHQVLLAGNHSLWEEFR